MQNCPYPIELMHSVESRICLLMSHLRDALYKCLKVLSKHDLRVHMKIFYNKKTKCLHLWVSNLCIMEKEWIMLTLRG